MIPVPLGVRVWLATGYTDMRRSGMIPRGHACSQKDWNEEGSSGRRRPMAW